MWHLYHEVLALCVNSKDGSIQRLNPMIVAFDWVSEVDIIHVKEDACDMSKGITHGWIGIIYTLEIKLEFKGNNPM